MNRISKEKNPCACASKIVNNYDEVVTWDKPEWINSEIVKPPKDRESYISLCTWLSN